MFKKIIAICIATGLLISCDQVSKSKKERAVTIQGTLNMSGFNELKLSKIAHGTLVEVATTSLDVNNRFQLDFLPESEGFYELTTAKYNHVFDNIPLYVKNGQAFNVVMDTTGYKIEQWPDRENEILAEWTVLMDTVNYYFRAGAGNRTTFKEFFPFYEQYLPKMAAFHNKVDSKNTKFNQLMHAYIDMTMNFKALSFLYSMRSEHPSEDQIPSFYKELMSMDLFSSALALELPNGMAALGRFELYRWIHKDQEIPNSEYITWLMEDISNQTLKAYQFYTSVGQSRALNDEYYDLINKYKDILDANPHIRKKLDALEERLSKHKPGVAGFEFVAMNRNGEEVSFSDFRGKYVYVDLWATWCGPCKAEIPHLQKLEKELHGKDIEFVSLSLDKPSDTQKWKNFVNENGLTGVQLIAENAFESKIAQEYEVTNIPRFFLFDKEGKMIDADAKRPSDDRLKEQLQKLVL